MLCAMGMNSAAGMNTAKSLEQHVRVLLIEDSPVDALLVRRHLERATDTLFDQCHIGSLAELADAAQPEPDVVLLDLGLPDSDGLETVHRVRVALPSAPIVVLSGHDDDQLAILAVREGARDYLLKGAIDPRALERTLLHAVEWSRAEAARRSAERELHAARKLEALGRLTAGIAHEINTPTQFIGDNLAFLGRSFSTVLATLRQCRDLVRRLVDPQAPRDYEALRLAAAALDSDEVRFCEEQIPAAVSEALDGVKRVATIVASTKALSHPGHGQRRAVDLHQVLDATLTLARGEWKRVAEVEREYDGALPPVLCYPDELNQVFVNLVVNAAQAMAAAAGAEGKGRITVRTRLDGGCAAIEIGDTGPGIPRELRDKIFEPFFTTKQVGEGSGQGLAIAYSVVVERHGGSIEVESERGRGTKFVVRLPLEHRPAA